MTARASQPRSGQARGAILLPAADGTVGYLPFGEINWQDGRITAVEPLDGVRPADGPLLLPGFVDLHVHWPQTAVRGRFSGALLPWLREHIWPAEAQFAETSAAAAGVEAFLRAAQRAGTCAGLVFGAPFAAASVAFAEIAPRGWFEGPALMQVHGPGELLRDPAEQLAALVAARPGHVFAVSPRFAPSLTAAGLRHCGDFAAVAGWPVQSHLSENVDEIAWVADLFADATDYTDVYDRAGLLGPRSIFAHGVHLSDRELARLAATGTWIAHCPTSNLALGSGRMPLERLRAHGVQWALATDVGAGPQLALLDAMRAAVQIHRGAAAITCCEALARATAIPGQFLGQFDGQLAGLGTLQTGSPAHLVAVAHPGGADAEDVLSRLLAALPADAESAPLQVTVWGTEMGVS